MNRLLPTLALAAAAFLLAGCDLSERFNTPEDRINAAVPLSIDIRQARERLTEQLGEHKTDRASSESAWIGRLRARAASCSPDFTPTWRHSSDEVRAALGNKACFSEFDRKLARWIGAQRVRLLLAHSPAAVAGLPPSVTLQGRLGSVSAKAPVVVVVSGEGFELLALNGGRILFKERGSVGKIDLAPNGRLFVQTVSGVSRIRAVEGGETLLELPDAQSVQWLGAWFLGVRGASNSKPAYLFSLNTAEESPVVIDSNGFHSIEALLPVPGGGNRFNLLTFTGLYQLQAQEDGGKFSVAVVAEKPGVHKRLMPITSGQGQISADGKDWVLAEDGALVVLDLTTLDVRETTFQPMHLDSVIPSTRPDQFVLELRMPMEAAEPGARVKYLYDATAATLAALDVTEAERSFLYLPSIGRLARVSESTVWLLEHLKTGEPQPMSNLKSIWLDNVNQAKLSQALIEEQRIAASPALQPGSPLFAAVRDAHVEGVGIYEAREKVARPGQSRSVGRVNVTVRRSARPLVLVLASYESVEWNLRLEPGARLGAVLVGGYYDSSVVGAGDARVLKIGSIYAYTQEGPEFAALQREVARWTGQNISLFQSGYHGASYTVGGR